MRPATSATAPAAPAWRAATLASAAYLAILLFRLAPMLAAPTTSFPKPSAPRPMAAVWSNDQMQLAWYAWRNARTMVTAPSRLFEAEQCFPASRVTTFVHHMFGEGLLGVAPYLLTGDPVITHNVVLVLQWWLHAVAMYVLVYAWTRSAPAAFVAGFLLAFHPLRSTAFEHIFLQSLIATPLALLFLHRLFTRQRWRDAAGLAVFASLQVFDNFYQTLSFAFLALPLAVYLAVRHVRDLRTLAPKLAVAGAATLLVVAVIMGPYLEAKETWSTLAGRRGMLNYFGSFGPGGFAFPGVVAVLLAAVGLLERLWRPRERDGHDPRVAYVVAGLFALWCTTSGLWFRGRMVVPSGYTVFEYLGLAPDVGRVIAETRLGVQVPVAFLAGYGVVVLLERLTHGRRLGAAALIVFAAAAEFFAAPLSTRSFGLDPSITAYEVRPPADVLALYGRFTEGAVLDLPLRSGAYYLFLSAFHRQPSAACEVSFVPPTVHEVAILANALPDPGAADKLHAIGFRSLVLHSDVMRRKLAPLLADETRIAPIGRAVLTSAYHLYGRTPVVDGLDALAAPALPAEPAEPVGPAVAFTIRNGAAATFRHPAPIEPTAMIVRWEMDGTPAVTQRTRVLLPLALLAGEAATRSVTVATPSVPGEYEVTLAAERAPERVIARRRILVGRPLG
jgi:hypothetical protein